VRFNIVSALASSGALMRAKNTGCSDSGALALDARRFT
jgi:hypothetical protein